MDSKAVNVNVTVDDFDSILSFADQSVWDTPDPSSSTFNATGSPWLMGTYHKTDIQNASLSINFTGPALYIYGYSGPNYGSYEVKIDTFSSTYSAFAATNASTPFLLFGANNLTYANHNLVLRNLGAQSGSGGNTLLFDYLLFTIQVAPEGATVSNVTYEENNPALTFEGEWGNNTSPDFSGGGSTFTDKDKASVTLSFNGSAIYMFGDKKNDHGLYSVSLDNQPIQVYSGISGCGGAFGMTCEQQKPTLQYLAHNLNDSVHTLRIENLAGVNNSFFDLDSIVVTVPSVYAVRDLANGTSPFVTSGQAPSATGNSGPTSTGAQSNAATSLLANPLIILMLTGLWLLKPILRPYER